MSPDYCHDMCRVACVIFLLTSWNQVFWKSRSVRYHPWWSPKSLQVCKHVLVHVRKLLLLVFWFLCFCFNSQVRRLLQNPFFIRVMNAPNVRIDISPRFCFCWWISQNSGADKCCPGGQISKSNSLPGAIASFCFVSLQLSISIQMKYVRCTPSWLSMYVQIVPTPRF